MFDPLTVLTWMFVDAVIIGFTSFGALWLRYLGDYPETAYNGWLTIYLALAVAYLAAFWFAGLYRLDREESYYRVLSRVVRGTGLGFLLSLALGYFLRRGDAIAYPTHAMLITALINLIVFAVFRLAVKRADEDHDWFNRKLEYLTYAILDGIVVNLAFLLAFWVRFRSLDFPAPDYEAYRALWFPITILFLIALHHARLCRMAVDDWFGRILWRALRTGLGGVLLTLALGFILRESHGALPSVIILLGGFFAVVLLAIWHLMRRRYEWTKVEWDWFAPDPEDEADGC